MVNGEDFPNGQPSTPQHRDMLCLQVQGRDIDYSTVRRRRTERQRTIRLEFYQAQHTNVYGVTQLCIDCITWK